jgi:hypothetical protein
VELLVGDGVEFLDEDANADRHGCCGTGTQDRGDADLIDVLGLESELLLWT